MKPRRAQLLTVLSITLLAGSLRLAGIGDWPYGPDELSTLAEESVLFHETDVDQEEALRLPRLVPVAYLLLHGGQSWFGDDEGGNRAVGAILGTLCVVAVFVFLDGPVPRAVALGTSLFMALWPEHVFRSQELRFYMVGAFFATMAMVFGARAMERRPALFAAFSGASSLLAAAECVGENWREGDLVAVEPTGLFRHYSNGCCADIMPVGLEAVPDLQALGDEENKVGWFCSGAVGAIPPTKEIGCSAVPDRRPRSGDGGSTMRSTWWRSSS